jgi:hypothetical protein
MASGGGGDEEAMASVVIDGQRVPLSADGLRSVRGDKGEVATKVIEAVRRTLDSTGTE